MGTVRQVTVYVGDLNAGDLCEYDACREKLGPRDAVVAIVSEGGTRIYHRPCAEAVLGQAIRVTAALIGLHGAP